MAKKRNKIRHKPRGSSKAGRPRQEGERYPSGKLKPRGPNKETLAKRSAGDASAGEHPLDFALSKGWISEGLHRTGMDYLSAFNRAHFDGAPRMAQGGLCEASSVEHFRETWCKFAEMPDKDIVELFDQVFNIEAPILTDDERAARDSMAWVRWKMLNAHLTREERQELFEVCVLASWPFWMPKEAAGRALGSKDETKKANLKSALGAVSRAMHPPKPSPTIIPIPDGLKPRQAKAEVPVNYETPDGLPVAPESSKGRPFDVVTRVRRREVMR